MNWTGRLYERDDFHFNVNILLGGQIGREIPNLYMIYPQGNPLSATEDSPYLQIGESKYGRPILDRGVLYDRTTLEEGAKFALISLDSTMRSNVTVGPPIDLVLYGANELKLTRFRRFAAEDPDLRHSRAVGAGAVQSSSRSAGRQIRSGAVKKWLAATRSGAIGSDEIAPLRVAANQSRYVNESAATAWQLGQSTPFGDWPPSPCRYRH